MLLPLEMLLSGAAVDSPVPAELLSRLHDLGWHLVAIPAPRGLGLGPEGIARLAMLAGRHLLPAHVAAESFLLAPALAEGDAAWSARLDALIDGKLSGGGGFAVDGGAWAWLAPEARVAAIDAGDRVLVADLERASASPITGLDAGQGLARLELTPSAVEDLPADRSGAVLRIHRLALIAQAVGIVDAVLDRTVEYARERQQFGASIASFQAVAHLLAGIRATRDSGRSALARLVALIELGDPEGADAVIDALACAIPESARQAVEDAIQVHGGMGFTWEYGLHLWYRRVLALQWALGGRRESAMRAGRCYVERRRLRAAVEVV